MSSIKDISKKCHIVHSKINCLEDREKAEAEINKYLAEGYKIEVQQSFFCDAKRGNYISVLLIKEAEQ